MNVLVILCLSLIRTSRASGTVCNQALDPSLILSFTASGDATGNKTSGYSVSFRNASNTSNWVSFSTVSPFIVTHVEFQSSATDASSPVLLPSSVRLQSTVASDETPVWYRTRPDRDMGLPWTSLPSKTTIADVPDGFEFTNIKIWPSIAPKTDAVSMSFKPVLYGCLSNETEVIRLEFNSSKSAVETSFSAMQFFEQAVSQIILDHTNISTSRYVVHAADIPPQSDQSVVKIYIRLLPDSDSQSESVKTLSRYLFDNSALISKLQALQASIVDTDAYLCHNKFCDLGWLCVGGQCYNPDGRQMMPALIPPPTQLRVGATQFRFYSESQNSADSSSESSSTVDYVVPIVIGSIIGLALITIIVNHVINNRLKNRSVVGTVEERQSLVGQT